MGWCRVEWEPSHPAAKELEKQFGEMNAEADRLDPLSRLEKDKEEAIRDGENLDVTPKQTGG